MGDGQEVMGRLLFETTFSYTMYTCAIFLVSLLLWGLAYLYEKQNKITSLLYYLCVFGATLYAAVISVLIVVVFLQ